MYYFIELWKGNAKWKAASPDEREDYFASIMGGNEALAEQGIEIVAWGENDRDTAERADYDFFSIWRMPSKAHAQQFEAAIQGVDWYGWFDQVNASGEGVDPSVITAKQARDGS